MTPRLCFFVKLCVVWACGRANLNFTHCYYNQGCLFLRLPINQSSLLGFSKQGDFEYLYSHECHIIRFQKQVRFWTSKMKFILFFSFEVLWSRIYGIRRYRAMMWREWVRREMERRLCLSIANGRVNRLSIFIWFFILFFKHLYKLNYV